MVCWGGRVLRGLLVVEAWRGRPVKDCRGVSACGRDLYSGEASFSRAPREGAAAIEGRRVSMGVWRGVEGRVGIHD